MCDGGRVCETMVGYVLWVVGYVRRWWGVCETVVGYVRRWWGVCVTVVGYV